MGEPVRSVIATMVFPETIPLAKMLIKSLRPRTTRPIVLFAVGCNPEKLGEHYRVLLNADALWKSLHDRMDRGVNDKAKSVMFSVLQEMAGVEEVLYLDADCLVLQPIDDVFRFKGGLLMAREELGFYEGYLGEMKCPVPQLTFNAGVILFRTDCSRWWGSFYELLCGKYDEKDHPHIEGQTVWNVVWQKHLGESAVLPQRYNQLHVKHGPHGAVLSHGGSEPEHEVARNAILLPSFLWRRAMMTRQDIIRGYIREVWPDVEMLEIGVNYGDTWHHQRGLILTVDISLAKVSVPMDDPRAHWVEMDSQNYWRMVGASPPNYVHRGKWNFIYIDGNHGYEVVSIDVREALKHLALGGYMLIHDVDIEENGPFCAYDEICAYDTDLACTLIGPEVHKLGMAVVKRIAEAV